MKRRWKRFVPASSNDDDLRNEEITNSQREEEAEQEAEESKRLKLGEEVSSFYLSLTSSSSPPSSNHSRPSPTSQQEEEDEEEEASSQQHCDHCDLLVSLPAWGQHLRSALHLFLKNRAAAHRPPHYYFLPESNVGYQMMLRRFHWQEEKGLGREGREGRLDPIATRLKRNRLGVGHRDEEKPRITHVGVNEVVRAAEERRSKGRKRRAARRRRKEREEEERKREERIRDAVFH